MRTLAARAGKNSKENRDIPFFISLQCTGISPWDTYLYGNAIKNIQRDKEKKAGCVVGISKHETAAPDSLCANGKGVFKSAHVRAQRTHLSVLARYTFHSSWWRRELEYICRCINVAAKIYRPPRRLVCESGSLARTGPRPPRVARAVLVSYKGRNGLGARVGQAGRPGRRDGEREGFALTGYVGSILREEAELPNARCRLREA